MAAASLIIKARIEEVPIIGQSTINAYIRDSADFTSYKPTKYIAGFLSALQTNLGLVNAAINPVTLTSELKVITLRLATNVLALRGTMNLLEGYVADASGLTVAAKDFGISPVRKKVASGDIEGLNLALSTLLTHIANNITALTAVGYTSGAQTALADVKQHIFDDSAAQTTKENARAALVVNNMTVINNFLTDIKSLWDDGKRLYKLSDTTKLKDYTNSAIIARIRNDEAHTLISGNVLNRLGLPEANAKIKARPNDGAKRGKTVKSAADGSYQLKGLRAATYLITVTLKDGHSFALNGDAVTNTTVTLNLQQPAA